MRVIVDIPDNVFNRLVAGEVQYGGITARIIFNSVKKGTPLPKGHGELIDKDVVLDMMNHGILEDYITTMGGVIPADK